VGVLRVEANPITTGTAKFSDNEEMPFTEKTKIKPYGNRTRILISLNFIRIFWVNPADKNRTNCCTPFITTKAGKRLPSITTNSYQKKIKIKHHGS
jgi:hypothetical protein